MNLVCKCGHVESSHGDLDITVEKRIQDLINARTLTAIHHPDRMHPDFIFNGEKSGKVYSYEAVEEILVNLRKNYSSCKKICDYGLTRCPCKNFKADNLKYLEQIYDERLKSNG